MDKILYLVTFDGHRDQYGSEIYLGGIFDSEDKAKDYANKMGGLCGDINITLVTINREYPAEKITSWQSASDIYLGGYVE